MSLNLIFHISDFHNLKVVNKIFFFIFEGGHTFLTRGVYGCKYLISVSLPQIRKNKTLLKGKYNFVIITM